MILEIDGLPDPFLTIRRPTLSMANNQIFFQKCINQRLVIRDFNGALIAFSSVSS